MSRKLRLGISPCPNDTFVFHGLLEECVSTEGLDLAIELADVEELNRRFAAGELDAAKCSFHAAAHLSRDAVVLPVGSALGFGVGPVLLSSPDARPLSPTSRVLCPGEMTTAHLLYRLFHRDIGKVEQVRFSEILPRLALGLELGHADFGVCIHEARFTYAERGLELVEDLGATWEHRTGHPLPLGGILARRELGEDVLARLSRAIAASLDHAQCHRAGALETMQRHAQELDEHVLWQHVELYVNAWTRDLGLDGERAISKLGAMARAAGLCPQSAPRLEVFRPLRVDQAP